MQDLLASVFIILSSATIVVTGTTAARPSERSLIMVSYLEHLIFCGVLYWMMENVYAVSDVQYYTTQAHLMRPMLDARPVYFFFEAVKLLGHLPSDLPIEHGSTASMVVVTAIGLWLTGSVVGLFLSCAIVSFFGKWALYVALRDELKPKTTAPLLVGTMLMPSVVFWTSGLVKEAFAAAGLGFLFLGVQRLVARFEVVLLPFVFVGYILVGGFKPFFLFAFVVALSMWLIFAKVPRAKAAAPFLVVVAFGVAIGGLALLGSIFKEFAVDNLLDSVAHHQKFAGVASENTGAAGYELGADAGQQRSAATQLLLSPLAVVATLARPFPWEIHNVTSAFAALELAVLAWLLGVSLSRAGVRGSARLVLARPLLVFVFVFTVASAVGVGLATANFGTLSRYRTPILPFYATLIIGLRQAVKEAPSGPKRALQGAGGLRLTREGALARASAQGRRSRHSS